jgi:hypothetical protein
MWTTHRRLHQSICQVVSDIPFNLFVNEIVRMLRRNKELTILHPNRQWSFWTLLIFSAVLTVLIIILVPETYHPVLLARRAKHLRQSRNDPRYIAALDKDDRTILQAILLSCKRPFQLLFLEPMVFNLCLFTAVLLGILYLFFGAFPLVFETNHDFQLWQVGCSFLGLLGGMVFAVASDHLWSINYRRLIRKHEAEGHEKGSSEPEFRLPPAIVGAIFTPIGMFWFGWTTYRSVHWIVPIIGSAVFGFGVVLVFSGIFTFLVDCYPLYAASALAANSFLRSSFAAAFPLFGVQMYDKLGFQWASSLLGFICIALVPWPYIFFKYGKRIRSKSRYAKSPE